MNPELTQRRYRQPERIQLQDAEKEVLIQQKLKQHRELEMSHFRWAALVFNSLLLMSVYMSLSSWAVAVPALEESFKLSSVLVMLGAGLLILGYGVGSYVQGRLLPKYGWKRVLSLVMMTFVASSLLIPYSPNYCVVLILRFVQGWGLVVTITVSSVSSWFPTAERGMAVGTLIGMIAGGVAVGGLLTGFLYPSLGWKLCFVLLAIPVAVVTVAYFLVMFNRSPTFTETVEELDQHSTYGLHRSKILLLLCICSFCLFFQIYGMYSILADYLYSIGYDAPTVGSFVMINGLLGLVASPLGGIVSDRLVKTMGLLKSRGYTMALIGYGWSTIGNWLLPYLSSSGYGFTALSQLMVGAPGSALNGPLWALPADLLGTRRGGESVAMMILVGSFGGFMAPMLITWVASTFGWIVGWLVMGAVMIPGIVIGVALPHLSEKFGAFNRPN